MLPCLAFPFYAGLPVGPQPDASSAKPAIATRIRTGLSDTASSLRRGFIVVRSRAPWHSRTSPLCALVLSGGRQCPIGSGTYLRSGKWRWFLSHYAWDHHNRQPPVLQPWGRLRIDFGENPIRGREGLTAVGAYAIVVHSVGGLRTGGYQQGRLI